MNSIALPVVLRLFAQPFSDRSLRAWVESQDFPANQRRGFYRRVYSLGVTLWYMVFQR
jgi:hypothetical protein